MTDKWPLFACAAMTKWTDMEYAARSADQMDAEYLKRLDARPDKRLEAPRGVSERPPHPAVETPPLPSMKGTRP